MMTMLIAYKDLYISHSDKQVLQLQKSFGHKSSAMNYEIFRDMKSIDDDVTIIDYNSS